jgi:putative ABC transport system permease protein
MIKNFFKSLFRSFKQKKVFTLINIGGLTLGITCSLIMFLIVKHEIGYDNYHENKDRIYRIVTTGTNFGNVYNRVGAPRPMAKAIPEEIVGLDAATYFNHRRFGQFTVTNEAGEEQEFTENRGVVYVQPSFFEMFTWEWIEGDPRTALDQPNTVVIDTENAEKMFPGESPIGKTLRFGNTSDLVVTGLVEKRPEQSDFPFEIFISMATFELENDMTRWGNTSSNERSYVMLNAGVSAESVNEQFPAFVTKYFGEKSTNVLSLQPLEDVHFDSVHGNLNYRSISKNLLYILSVVCVFIVITACFNFINMSTAMAIKRSKEVGIRKVLGSTRKSLVTKFLLETLLITFLSVVLSLAITERLLPGVVKGFTELDLSLNLLTDFNLVAYLIILIIFVTAVAGLYPAWVISAFQPAQVLRGSALSGGGKRMGLRRILVTFQFALSQIFIFGTLIAVWQMQFVRTTDLGYDRDWIVYVDLPYGEVDQSSVWKGDLDANSSVLEYSFAGTTPFSGSSSSTDGSYENEDGVQNLSVFLKPADGNYLNTYGMKLIAGEDLLNGDKRNRYVINEAFVKKMGIKPLEAVGMSLTISGQTHPIAGVVKDFHMKTLRVAVQPIALYNAPDQYNSIGIKFSPGSADKIIKDLEASWNNIYPDKEFRYGFFDEYLGRYYSKEKKFSEMLITFASIAIFICCLGLYGLVSFMANQKIKEIGIRKVLGASIKSIVGSFSWEFVRLVGIAFLIAAPIAYYGMQSWLNDFVYRIEVGPMIFIVGIILSLLVTLITTSYRSFKAARSNPVESLRSE